MRPLTDRTPKPLLPENREFSIRKVRSEPAVRGSAWDGDAVRRFHRALLSVQSVLKHFREEIDAHVLKGKCPSGICFTASARAGEAQRVGIRP